MASESPQLAKLKTKLAELFELDKADLDFGIYRVLRQRHEEISSFLEGKLTSVVEETLAAFAETDTSQLRNDLKKAEQAAKEAGISPDDSPKVREIREKLEQAPDSSEIEEEVYSHLLTFFSRYYDGGDFISQRRHKKGDSYAIPYDGEEVKLIWANMDQYYIKSSELLRDYQFRWKPSGEARDGELALEDGEEDEVIVKFLLVEGDTEKDNRKSTGKTTRAFALDPDKPYLVEDQTLFIRFSYREHPTKTNLQTYLNTDTVKTLADVLPEDWKKRLFAKAPTDKNPNRTVLEKHLSSYTAKHQFDYFIHKDLGGFLRRELDFYLKNEVLHLDDIESETAPRAEEFLSRLRALRRVATPVVEMLEQLEGFQKKLWLKKKFVVETRYVMTLDRVPEELYPQIVESEAQWEEWEELFKVSKVKEFSRSVGFLKANQSLQIDSKHFSPDFIQSLVASVEDWSETDGVVVESNNFHALRLIEPRFLGGITTIYNDPPYNTDASAILYKNGFRNSSWCSLIGDVLSLCAELLSPKGIHCLTIDDKQFVEVASIIRAVFGDENVLGNVAIRSNPSGRITLRGVAQCHEYAIFSSRTGEGSLGKLPRNEKQASRFDQEDEVGKFEWRNFRRDGSSSTRADRPKQFFPIFVKEESFRIPQLQWNDDDREYRTLDDPDADEVALFPIDSKGNERCWRWGLETAREKAQEIVVKRNPKGELQLYNKYRPNSDGILPLTIWTDKRYSATEYGTAVTKNLFGSRSPFDFPKSVFATQDCLRVANLGKTDWVLDCFAGSGTTAHAVVDLNRADQGARKFILVEQGAHAEEILVPRVKKAVYSSGWRDGAPLNRDSGISHAFKIIRLESYEDCLNNLVLQRDDAQQRQLDDHPEIKDGYMLRYFLDVESQESLLNTAMFRRPFDYQLDIATSSAGETVPTKVDLVETFNWLLGLKVRHIDFPKGFVTVSGTDREEEQQILIIWRNLEGEDAEDHEALTKFLAKIQVNPADTEYDAIYLNGPHTLDDPHNKIRLTEEHFHRLMFEGTE